jgi:hypothetical protein
MKDYEFSSYMRENGLKHIGGGSKYSYWSFFNHLYGYSIRQGARNAVVVYREHTEIRRGYPKMTDTKVTTEKYYGKLTPLILEKWLEVASQPPKRMTYIKSTIIEGLKKRKPLDRELIRDFAVELAAAADRIEARAGAGDYWARDRRKRSDALFALMDEDSPSLFEIRRRVVGD